MGQSAILQTPEYLSRATMRLPMNLRVRWYEHIDGRSGRSTLLEFEKWLCKRVDTLFNPFEDFICEEWNKKQKFMRPRSSLKLHPLTTTTELPTEVLRDSSNVLDFKLARVQFRSKEGGNKAQSNEKICVICHVKHRIAFCPVFKSKPLQERRKIAWEYELCFNCLKASHQAKDFPSTNRCLREQCRRPHHTLLHEDYRADSSIEGANKTLGSFT